MQIRYFHRIRQRFVRDRIYRALLPHFDEVFYRDNNKDLSDCGDLLAHYIDIGWKEAKNPTSWFSTYTYLEKNPDVRDARINPFYHYIVYGRAEGRSPARKEGEMPTYRPEFSVGIQQRGIDKTLDDAEKLRIALEALLALFDFEPQLPKSDNPRA
jgi:hypothetical protein